MTQKPRSPILAAALSILVPGLGQLYAGRLARALAFTFIGALAFFLLTRTIVSGDLFAVLGFQVLAGSIYSVVVVIDAWRVAKQAPDDYQPDERNRIATYIWFSLVTLICTGFMAAVEVRRLKDEFQTYRMSGNSMAPTLIANDMIYVNHEPFLESNPKRGELVVYRSPQQRTQKWIGRVIGLPGDAIEIKTGKLLVNGATVSKGGSSTSELLGDFSYEVQGMGEVKDFAETIIAPHHVFILGDNRSNSFDSRHFGAVSLGILDGSLRVRYWPRNRAGKLNVSMTR
ncbi:MAG: signal peptidase I [Verrucomicrobiota bacterium]